MPTNKHDLPATQQEQPLQSRVDLKSRYHKIGISAVVAALRYQGSLQASPSSQLTRPDRSTARGWSPMQA